jgi:hypothetical protein
VDELLKWQVGGGGGNVRKGTDLSLSDVDRDETVCLPELQELSSEAKGHANVVKPLRRPLRQLAQQRRKVLAWLQLSDVINSNITRLSSNHSFLAQAIKRKVKSKPG